MTLTEINFDGIVGPSHNYAGLSRGNIASSNNAGAVSYPRAAALQGLAKMRRVMELGVVQGWFMPLDRPNRRWLDRLGTDLASAEPHLRAAAWSASAMWAANAATVSPAPDTSDGRCHLTVANLVTMPHRSHEWRGTLQQLSLAFADPNAFAVHGPVDPPFGDEGAANHMRLAPAHDAPGLEVFVYGRDGGGFPARQHREASAVVARRHGLDPERVLLIEQAPRAIAAGAFHNDVVAVANGPVLLAHEAAFADRDGALAAMRAAAPWMEFVEVREADVPLADAIRGYLFNGQLITRLSGGMALVIPTEAAETPSIARWAERTLAANGPIREVVPVDVRQSMANGGGPACLRLRVVCDPQTVDPRFIVNADRLARAEDVVAHHWPETIAPADLSCGSLIDVVRAARAALLQALDLTELMREDG